MATKSPTSATAAALAKNPARPAGARGASHRGSVARPASSHSTAAQSDETPALSSLPELDNNSPLRMNTKNKSTRQSTSDTQQRSDLDIEYFRGLLLAERGRLEEERDARRKNNIDMDTALPEEGEGGDEDTADLASAMMDKEFELSVEDEIDSRLQSVDHALQKMDDGTYGVCDMSGEPIPAGRLELIPWASLTVECQALAEGE